MLEAALREAAAAIGARVLNVAFHAFAPHGVTGVLLLAESHLSVHTWPEHGYAAVDLFTCGPASPEAALPILRAALGARELECVTVVRGVDATVQMGGNVLGVLGGLFRGQVSVSQLGGPVEIARASVTAAQTGTGLENLWALVAFLSINLAILNLLPIPLLDGGQIVLNLVEGAIRKPLPAMVKEWYARIGLAAILLLFVTVTFNDLKRLVLGWFGGE